MKSFIKSCWTALTLLFVHEVASYGPIRIRTIPCTGKSYEVHSCLHTYLERDVAEIHGMIYPHRISSCDELQRPNQSVTSGGAVEVPALVDHCSKIWDAYICLNNQLETCPSIIDFFNLRHLLYSLGKSIRWFCGLPGKPGPESSDNNIHQEVHHNFPALLRSIHCLECYRISSQVKHKCVQSTDENWIGDPQLWPKVFRMEVGAEICSQLSRQSKCFLDSLDSHSNCQQNSTAFRHLFNTFVMTWCEHHPLRPSSGHRFFSYLPICISGVVFHTLLFSYMTA